MNLIEQYEVEGKIIRIPFSGCWIWLGATSRGYGTVWRDKFRGDYIHRVSWQIFRGDIPEGKLVCHYCDIKCCLNPDHLFLGTHWDNVLDALVKDRYSKIAITHCKRGHEFTIENTYNHSGLRHCRSCRKLWKLEHKNK